MKRPLSGPLSRQPLRAVHLRKTALRIFWRAASEKSRGNFGRLAQSRSSNSAGIRAQGQRTNKAGLLRWLRPAHAVRDLFKAFAGIGKLANEEHQRGGLGIGLGAALLQTWIARIFRMVLFGSYIPSIVFIPVSKTGRHMQCRSTCRLGFLLPLPSAREKLPSLLPRARAVW